MTIEELLKDSRTLGILEHLISEEPALVDMPKPPKGFAYTGEFRVPRSGDYAMTLDGELYDINCDDWIPVWIVHPVDKEDNHA